MSFSARRKVNGEVTVWDRRGILRGERRELHEQVLVEEPPPAFGNTDIHILRDGTELCPKQDLAFSLQDGDVVVFEVLFC